MASLRPARLVPRVAAVAVVVGLFGCSSGDGVHSYTVPRTSEKSGPAAEYRILGAIYPADNPVWYFKLTGTAAELAKHEADFDKFAASVKLKPDGSVPDFKLPDGWARGGPRSVSRMGVTVTFDETVKFGPNELTISKAEGGTLQNVDRWAKQVGIPGVTPDTLKQYTREFAADGTKGVRVDVVGKSNPAGGPMMGGKR